MTIQQDYFPLQGETDQIIGISIEVHKELGHGFLEIVYKDAPEYEIRQRDFSYEREKEYLIKTLYYLISSLLILLFLTK